MNEKEAHNEFVFLMTMHIARKMLEKQLITREQYVEFDTKMRQKHKPIFGSLFSDINLM